MMTASGLKNVAESAPRREDFPAPGPVSASEAPAPSPAEDESKAWAKLEAVVFVTKSKNVFLRGAALAQIRQSRLYLRKAPTFEEYCQRVFKLGHSHANRLMEAARISRIISPNGEDKPERESQVRPLASLAPEAMRKVWARGVQQAKGGRLSAKMVERAVANLFPQNVKTVGSARLARKLGKRLAALAAACRGEGWAEAEMESFQPAEILFQRIAFQNRTLHL